jgi:hypothetical protein
VERVETVEGEREFAAGDRIYFLKNDRGLGVKNGSLGTVEKIQEGVLQVRVDGSEERRVTVDTSHCNHLEQRCAAIVYKAQGTTVDRTYVLATPHFDRHSTYVALSRHREGAALFYGEADFKHERSRASARENLDAVLSRARPTELAHDCLERGISLDSEMAGPPAAPQRAAGARRRGSFDGLKLRGASREVRREAFAGVQASAQARSPEAAQPEGTEPPRAADCYAQAWMDAQRMQEQTLPIFEHQKAALSEAGMALDAVRPWGGC